MLGMSLSDFLVAEVAEIAARPTVEEMLERLSKRSSVELGEPAAESVRSARLSRP
jgi:antitoxin FitA